jgi:hypothetical protein
VIISPEIVKATRTSSALCHHNHVMGMWRLTARVPNLAKSETLRGENRCEAAHGRGSNIECQQLAELSQSANRTRATDKLSKKFNSLSKKMHHAGRPCGSFSASMESQRKPRPLSPGLKDCLMLDSKGCAPLDAQIPINGCPKKIQFIQKMQRVLNS